MDTVAPIRHTLNAMHLIWAIRADIVTVLLAVVAFLDEASLIRRCMDDLAELLPSEAGFSFNVIELSCGSSQKKERKGQV